MTSTAPEFRRRREIGAASARSLLLTVLGEFVLTPGRPVWTSALLHALSLVDVEEKAIRQALARSAAEGWLESERHGRRTAWHLTTAGRRLLTEGAERIFGFGTPVTAWDGQWLIVLASVPETNRRLRHLLRTRLAWNGLGNLSPGVWVSPHPERRPEVLDVLDQVAEATTAPGSAARSGADRAPRGGTTPHAPRRASGADQEGPRPALELATVFTGRLGGLDEARRVARQAWDLAEIERAYADFLEEVRLLRPRDGAEVFAAQVRLVQEWRRFPLLDPGLPPELLPADWNGTRAAAVFRDRHEAWRPAARRYWAEIAT